MNRVGPSSQRHKGTLILIRVRLSPLSLLVVALAMGLRLWSAMGIGYVDYVEGPLLHEGMSIREGNPPQWDRAGMTPLFPYILSLGLAIGWGIPIGRLVSAMSAVATTLFVYLIGKEIFDDEKVGLLAGLFYAISPNAIRWAGVSRGEELVILLVVLSVYSFLKATEGERECYLLAGLFAGLASVTRPVTLAPLAYVLYLLYESVRTREIRRNAVGLALVACGYAVAMAAGLALFAALSTDLTVLGRHITGLFKPVSALTPSIVLAFVREELPLVIGSWLFLVASLLWGASESALLGLWLLSVLAQLAVISTASPQPFYLTHLIPLASLMSASVAQRLYSYAIKLSIKGKRDFYIDLRSLFLLVLAFSSLSTYLLAGLSLSFVARDDFDDGILDDAMWATGYLFGESGGQLNEAGGRLLTGVVGAEEPSEYGAWTRPAFAGTLSATAAFNSTVSRRRDYGYCILRIGRAIDSGIDAEGCVWISLQYTAEGQQVYGCKIVNGSTVRERAWKGALAQGATGGRLRIDREDGTVALWFDVGDGWQQLASWRWEWEGDVRLSLSSSSVAGRPDVLVEWDDFAVCVGPY